MRVYLWSPAGAAYRLTRRQLFSGSRQLLQTGVGVEKGTKAVISVNFSVYGRRTFNSLRTNFAIEFP